MMEQPFYEEEIAAAVDKQLGYWREKLNETDRRLLSFFMWEQHSEVYGALSLERLAEEVGRSKRSVQRSIQKLKNYAMIELDENRQVFYVVLEERGGADELY